MGLIEVDDSGKNYIYYATCTKRRCNAEMDKKISKNIF